jgi:hypothetical protein
MTEWKRWTMAAPWAESNGGRGGGVGVEEWECETKPESTDSKVGGASRQSMHCGRIVVAVECGRLRVYSTPCPAGLQISLASTD